MPMCAWFLAWTLSLTSMIVFSLLRIAAISSKHTLAIVNRGGATAAEIVQLASYVQTRVLSQFGVVLHPEPVLVGVHL